MDRRGFDPEFALAFRGAFARDDLVFHPPKRMADRAFEPVFDPGESSTEVTPISVMP
jgi:hypothetical protein